MKSGLTAKQKRSWKLIFDAVMLVLLILMYRKQVISLTFHEVGGLALVGLVVIHLLFNARWIGAVTKHLFSKSTGIHARACYIVDALLLLALLTVGITGVLISKVVFSFHVTGNFKTLHYFSAALSVILMGVHLGLHADYIFGKLLKKSAGKAAKITLAAVLTAAVLFGGYSLYSSSFVSFLTAPIQAASISHATFSPSGDIALDGADEQRPMDLSELPDAGTESNLPVPSPADNDAQQDGSTPSAPSGDDYAGSGGHGNGRGEGLGDGNGNGNGNGNGGESGSLSGALLLVAQYIGIITLFAALTYAVLKLVRRKPHGGAAAEETECERLLDGGAPSANEPGDDRDDETQEN